MKLLRVFIRLSAQKGEKCLKNLVGTLKFGHLVYLVMEQEVLFKTTLMLLCMRNIK